jgi:acid phosphatase (class A)
VADRNSAFAVFSRRTPEDVARGHSENTFTIFEFSPEVGPFFRPEKCPKVAALFREVSAECKAVVVSAKSTWNRPRPFVADPVRFAGHQETDSNGCYPSGHAMQSTVFAILLAEMFPDRREAIFKKGRTISWTRVEVGVHTPLDIYAGRVLGQSLAGQFLSNPVFRRDMAESNAEAGAAERAVGSGPANPPRPAPSGANPAAPR